MFSEILDTRLIIIAMTVQKIVGSFKKKIAKHTGYKIMFKFMFTKRLNLK